MRACAGQEGEGILRLINLAGSKLLASIGYNPNTQTLIAQFHKGGDFYAYEGVDSGVFISVITDPISHGTAFHEKIRGGGYPYRKVARDEVDRL